MSHTHIVLIRHGETDANRGRIFQGQTGLGLNSRGREQAQLLGARLKQTDLRLDALYASDLNRAWETAEIVGDYVGLTPMAEPGLREVYLGAWQGLSYEEAAAQFADEWAAWRRGEDVRRGGGENYTDLQTRMLTTLERLARAHPDQTIACVSHGAAIKLFVAGVLGIPFTRLHAYHVMSNTGVCLVNFHPDAGWELMTVNDTRHLPDDPLAGLFIEDA